MAGYRASFTFATRQFVALHLRLQLFNRIVCRSFSNVSVYNGDSAVFRNVGTDLINEAAKSRKLSLSGRQWTLEAMHKKEITSQQNEQKGSRNIKEKRRISFIFFFFHFLCDKCRRGTSWFID